MVVLLVLVVLVLVPVLLAVFVVLAVLALARRKIRRLKFNGSRLTSLQVICRHASA